MRELTEKEAVAELNWINRALQLPEVRDSSLQGTLPILEALVHRVQSLEREVFGFDDE